MALELKIEGLRARGEITAQERDRLIQCLRNAPARPRKAAFFTPLRSFLLGAVVGVGLAYLTWGLLT